MTPGFVRALSVDAVAPGGMVAVNLEGQELVICRSNETWYAIERRCGHMNAPLDKGTLTGSVVTCPMHCAQFDLLTGAVSCGPMPHAVGPPPPGARAAQLRHELFAMIGEVRTLPIRTLEVEVESGTVSVRLKSAPLTSGGVP